HSKIPRLGIGIFEVQRNVEIIRILQGRSTERNDSVRRNRNWNGCRESGLEGGYSNAIVKNGRARSGARRIERVVRTDGIVVSVVVVRERHVADAEPSTNDGVVCDPIGEASARRPIPVSRLHTQIRGIAANTGYYEGAVGGVIVRESACVLRSGRGIELPANAEVDRQLRGYLPFVAGKGEEPPLPIGGKECVKVAACLAWHVKEEAGDVICRVGGGPRL